MEARHWYWIAAALVGIGIILVLYNLDYSTSTALFVE